MSLRELLGNVGIFGGAVMFCLAALSVFSLAVIVEKHRRFRTASRQSQMFKSVLKNFVHGGDIEALIAALPVHSKSHVAQVVSAGILEYEGVRQAGRNPATS